ncbi:MAG TPA: peptide ABC transporter substrate-binding protein [Nitrolancea sp.]|nr:peptide ABC transporter substrate-binding protein [Nitrolancea sp.]
MASFNWWEDSEQIKLLHTRLEAIGVDRRKFLKIVGAAGGASAVALAVAACGGSSSTPTAASASTAAPTTASSGGTTATPAATTAGGATPAATTASSTATTAATASAASTVDLATDQTFTMNSTIEPNSFDFNKDLYCNGNAACFAQLAQFDPNLAVIPDIAEKWESNADASVWTFHLRPSKWSNGAPVTAGDYEYSYKRQLDPKTAAPYAGFLYDIKNAQAFNQGKGNLTANDVGVKATDDSTLVVTLEGPRGYFAVLAAYVAAAPSYQPAVEKYGDKWTEAENIVCNGPFTLTEWKHNESYTLTRNDNYWNASKITLKTTKWPIIAATAEFTAYQNSEIDMSLHGSLGNLAKVQSDATMSKEYFKYNLFGTWYLEPNVKMAPFDTKEVRLAMAHAIDRDTIVKNVLKGLGTVAYTMTPPGMPGFDSNTYDSFTKYDPAAAMAALKGTPYEGGKNWPKIVMTQRNNEGDAPVAVGDAMIAMLKQNLNMTIEHVLGDPKQVYNEQYQGKNQLIWWRWYIDYPDPNNTMYLVWYSQFPSGERNTYSNPQMDQLLTQAAAESDQTKRNAMYQQAQQMIIQDGAGIFVYNPWNYGLKKPYVADVPKDKDGNYVPDWNVFVRMTDRIKIAKH